VLAVGASLAEGWLLKLTLATLVAQQSFLEQLNLFDIVFVHTIEQLNDLAAHVLEVIFRQGGHRIDFRFQFLEAPAKFSVIALQTLDAAIEVWFFLADHCHVAVAFLEVHHSQQMPGERLHRELHARHFPGQTYRGRLPRERHAQRFFDVVENPMFHPRGLSLSDGV